MAAHRSLTLADKICIGIDQALRAINDNAPTSGAKYPALDFPEAKLNEQERRSVIGLMRVNHAGEIAAQALYHGQGLLSRSLATERQMQQAALEEGDHLAWCRMRIDELGGHTSYLKPIWYAGSFCIGMVAGMVGDKWSLGFVAETERQVIKHLEKHCHLLPAKDQRSRQVLRQMEQDEAKHRNEAIAAGAHPLPKLVQKLMALTSKIMVKTAYWI